MNINGRRLNWLEVIKRHKFLSTTKRDKKNKQVSGPAIAEYGSKVLVRNSSPEVREGKKSSVAIVIEIDSIENARKFYESENYTAARAVRELVADDDLIVVEGL